MVKLANDKRINELVFHVKTPIIWASFISIVYKRVYDFGARTKANIYLILPIKVENYRQLLVIYY